MTIKALCLHISTIFPFEQTSPSAFKTCPVNQYNIQKHSEFGKGGCVLFDWPSSDGVLIKEPANIADLEFLSVNRHKESSSSINAAEKDVFCANMKKIGVKWWESEEDYISAVVGERERTPQESVELFVVWLATEGV